MQIKPKQDKLLKVKFKVYEEEYYALQEWLIRESEWEASLHRIFEWLDLHYVEQLNLLSNALDDDGLYQLIEEFYYNEIEFFHLGSYEEAQINKEDLNKVKEEVLSEIKSLLKELED